MRYCRWPNTGSHKSFEAGRPVRGRPRAFLGTYLDGAKSYRLHILPNIPANNFWSVVVYDTLSRSELQNGQPLPFVSSYTKPTIKADGSIDIAFGPEEPEDGGNWIRTVPGKGWFLFAPNLVQSLRYACSKDILSVDLREEALCAAKPQLSSRCSCWRRSAPRPPISSCGGSRASTPRRMRRLRRSSPPLSRRAASRSSLSTIHRRTFRVRLMLPWRQISRPTSPSA